MDSLTPRDSPTSHHSDAYDFAFDRYEGLDTPDETPSALHSPAHSYRYRCFASTLSGTDARLVVVSGGGALAVVADSTILFHVVGG